MRNKGDGSEKMYDTIGSNLQALKKRKTCEHCGSLFIPIILEKLPKTAKLQIGRRFCSKNRNKVHFLVVVNEEIVTRGQFEYLKQNGVLCLSTTKNMRN